MEAALAGAEEAAVGLKGNPGVLVLGVALLAFVAHLVNTAIMGMTVVLIDGHLKGFVPSLSVALRKVARNLGGLVALAAIGTAVGLVTGALRSSARERRGLANLVVRPLLNAAASAIETAWTALSFLLLPVIMIEDRGLGGALDRVRAIHRDSLLPVAAGEIGLRALSGIAGVLVFVCFLLLGMLLWPLTVREIVVMVALFALALAVLTVVGAFVRGAYYTCLYLAAAEAERAGDPAGAVVPAPLALALRD
jgi:hypothetical protein